MHVSYGAYSHNHGEHYWPFYGTPLPFLRIGHCPLCGYTLPVVRGPPPTTRGPPARSPGYAQAPRGEVPGRAGGVARRPPLPAPGPLVAPLPASRRYGGVRGAGTGTGHLSLDRQ